VNDIILFNQAIVEPLATLRRLRCFACSVNYGVVL